MLRCSSALKRCVQAALLELLLQPQPLLGVGHVRELRAHAAGVDVLQLRQDVAQLHALGDRGGAAAGDEFAVEVGRRQAEVVEVQHPRARARHEAERIDARQQVPAVDPHLDQARHRRLACVGAVSGTGAAGARGGTLRQLAAHRSVGTLGGGRTELREIVAPVRGYALRIAQVLLVERVEEFGVTAVEGSWFQHGKAQRRGLV